MSEVWLHFRNLPDLLALRVLRWLARRHECDVVDPGWCWECRKPWPCRPWLDATNDAGDLAEKLAAKGVYE